MVAVDTQLAMLAAQCLLTLVAIPPSAEAIAVRSPLSGHGGVAGSPHHQRHTALPLPARNKHHSYDESHDSKSTSKSKRHQGRSLLTVSQEEQRSFQARDSHARDTIVSGLRPLLEQVLGALKPVLGDVPLVDPVLEILRPILGDILDDVVAATKTLGARHRYDHYTEKIIIDEYPRLSHEHIHARAYFEHAQRRKGGSGKRDLEPTRGVIAAMSADFVTFLSADKTFSELSASPDAGTSFILDDVPWLSSYTYSTAIPVLLRLDQGNMASDDSEKRCATYDPHPSSPSTLKLDRCFVSADNATEHEDQVFSLNSISNQLQTWNSDNTTSAYQDVRMNARDNTPNDVVLFFKPAPLMAEAPTSLTTVTITTTTTQTQSSSIAAADTSTSIDPTSTSSPSSMLQSPLEQFNIEVAPPSVTPSGTESYENSSASLSDTPSSSVDFTSQTATGSPTAGVSPSPAPLVFEVNEKGNSASGSTMTV